MSEKTTQTETMLVLGSRPDIRVFRNNVGLAYQGDVATENHPLITLRNYRRVHYGLANGSGDLIGYRSIKIIPEYIGRQLAVFTSIEFKSAHGRATESQVNWAAQVIKAGGIAGIVRSADEAIEVVYGW